VAHWLRDRGYEAYAVIGGVSALSGERVELPVDASLYDDVEQVAVRALATLRHRNFRLYSIGVMCSFVGTWIESAAFGYVVLLLGGSAATLGLIGFLNTIPNLVFGLPAGTLADRFDRRRLLIVFQSVNLCVSAALAVLYASDSLTVATMGALAVVGGSLGALSFPAFQGMLADTVPVRDLENAVAVNSLSLQVARFVGPAIAGFLLAAAGPAWVFGANAFSFVAVIAAIAMLPASRSAVSRVAGGIGSSMGDAIRYVFGQRTIAALMGLMLVAGLFATPPVAFMIPGIVEFNLGGGGATLGILTASIGLGSVAGSVALLRLSRRPNKGEPLLAGFVIAGAAIAGMGASTFLPLSCVLGVLGGFGGVLFVGLSTVVVQSSSSDEMRARAMAIWAALFVGMLPFGALITSGLSDWLGAGGAVLVDGVLVLVGGLVVFVVRREVTWLGCAALPETCIAATSPVAVALEVERA
jgi:MFS family permease